MPNPVVHVEIAGSDDAKIRQFYRDAFDWEVAAENPMQYGLVQPRGEGIWGCIGAGPAPSVTRCNSPEYVPHIFYVQVDGSGGDARAGPGARRRGGAGDHGHPRDVTMATLRDPEGNVIGIVDGGRPPRSSARGAESSLLVPGVPPE